VDNPGECHIRVIHELLLTNDCAVSKRELSWPVQRSLVAVMNPATMAPRPPIKAQLLVSQKNFV
jgi:hypothetical protein